MTSLTFAVHFLPVQIDERLATGARVAHALRFREPSALRISATGAFTHASRANSLVAFRRRARADVIVVFVGSGTRVVCVRLFLIFIADVIFWIIRDAIFFLGLIVVGDVIVRRFCRIIVVDVGFVCDVSTVRRIVVIGFCDVTVVVVAFVATVALFRRVVPQRTLRLRCWRSFKQNTMTSTAVSYYEA